MAIVLQTDQAGEDLLRIWEYIAQDNEEAADRFLDRVDEACKMLANNSLSGMHRAELAEGLRSLPVGNYLIFYRPIEQGIEVIRVLHGARDVDALL